MNENKYIKYSSKNIKNCIERKYKCYNKRKQLKVMSKKKSFKTKKEK